MRHLPILAAALLAFAGGIGVTWLVLRHTPTPPYAAPVMAAAPNARKVLYWYDPMAPQQHFDHPGKSPLMDMQLVPKYADATDAGTLSIDPRTVQNLGVRTARVVRARLQSTVRATGTLAYDERAVAVVQSRVPGIVEQLIVRTPLARVARGDALLTLIAPDWTAAQAEYLSLQRAQASGLKDLRAAARQRLQLLGMSEDQIRAVERSGQAQTRITLRAPQAGVIGQLDVRDGATVAAGAPLMTINGLDTVWLDAAIPEAQVGRIAPGASIEAELPAFPGESFKGSIDALLPAVDATTRSLTARIVLPNPDHRLAPGMFARVRIASADASLNVLVPTEALIATGVRTVVIVDDGDGRFRAQEVRVGDEADGNSVILQGLQAGESVVLSGQFLIDSEASLGGTLTRLEGPQHVHAPDAPAPHGGQP